MFYLLCFYLFFFFNDTATTEIYTLSLHDALPISKGKGQIHVAFYSNEDLARLLEVFLDRKSTRLNSSHSQISYAVFCLKKKKKKYASLSVARIAHTQSYTMLARARHRRRQP